MTALTQTVRDIALENPTSIRVFEEFGIDYCCGGRKPLAEACAARNLAVDDVIAALERASVCQQTPRRRPRQSHGRKNRRWPRQGT